MTVDSGKLRLLVNHICQSLRIGIDSKKIFTPEEEKKLLLSLNLKQIDLDILLNTLITVYNKAAFAEVKPQIVDATMKNDFQLDEEKAAIISQSWSLCGKGIIDAFRQKSTLPNQVSEINWSLNIQSSSMASATEIRPVVNLQLNFGNPSDSKLTVEFDKKDLSDLYHNLEDIQTQLDALK